MEEEKKEIVEEAKVEASVENEVVQEETLPVTEENK